MSKELIDREIVNILGGPEPGEDTKRLDWLEANADSICYLWTTGDKWIVSVISKDCRAYRGGTFRGAIDKAMGGA
jgi:hypothetical protein